MKNENGLALDAWIDAIPDDVYDPCPCGCGEKMRFVIRDEKKLEQHEIKFIQNFLRGGLDIGTDNASPLAEDDLWMEEFH